MNAPTKKPQPAETVENILDDMDRRSANLAGALVKALAEIEGVSKDKVNPHFKSKYADLASALEAVRPVFAKYDLAVTQETSPSEDGVIVETVVLHASGEERRFGQLYLPANKRDAQGFGSALTYAKRYSVLTALGIPTEDDDGNAAARTTANPSTGEPRSRARDEKLDGPYDTIPKLERAVKEFCHTLRGLGSIEEFNDLRKDKEVKAFVAQCKRDLPGWWTKRHDTPDDWKPLEEEIAETERGLMMLAEMENN